MSTLKRTKTPPGSLLIIKKDGAEVTVLTSSQEETADVLAMYLKEDIVLCEPAVNYEDKERPEYRGLLHIP